MQALDSETQLLEMDSRVQELKSNGFTILRQAYDTESVALARKTVLDHRDLSRNTRPTASAGHIAGFHRFPQLESLHTLLTANSEIREIIERAIGDGQVKTIGLSDITINRSQQWHNDLLRGNYRSYLSPEICWGSQGGGVVKILLYLQKGSSLRVISGSHLEPVSLESDEQMIPQDDGRVTNLAVEPGDVILIDLRLTHRGSTEDEMQRLEALGEPKILVSTVYGGASRKLTRAMELGNFHRLMDWEDRNSQSRSSDSVD